MKGIKVFSPATRKSFEAFGFRLYSSSFEGYVFIYLDGYDLQAGCYRLIESFFDIEDAWSVYSCFCKRLRELEKTSPELRKLEIELKQSVKTFPDSLWEDLKDVVALEEKSLEDLDPEEPLEDLPFAPEPETALEEPLEDLSTAPGLKKLSAVIVLNAIGDDFLCGHVLITAHKGLTDSYYYNVDGFDIKAGYYQTIKTFFNLDDAFSLKQFIENCISEYSPYRYFFSTGSRKEYTS